ncbi:MAG TPA: HEAT repeat domain-containing protein [Verrucomicrobiae bacterium]|nr:HEAT repeat domain-containing protein [Verrucomicrobiae bacterium]
MTSSRFSFFWNKRCPLSASILAVLLAALSGGQVRAAENSVPLTDAEILKKITAPAEFEATVFAAPTNISYPIFLSAAVDGTLFVGCDENGSLDRKPGRGRVVMCRDTDGDGRADKFSDFAKMDSPRGVAWDASTSTLYVMHPPFLTAYHDDSHTGVANRSEDLITGLGFGLDFRGADHTINGIRLGIDGWIYIACGDYGAVKATGKDGRSLSLRGGGIVRIRPDGTGLEQVVWGTRNILAVAISPTLDLFTRDNTNDGDDWNDRLSFNPIGGQMGYPTLFRNFADETIPAMIDFGGGSPVGSIFIDEPALPKPWSYGFYSVEWGRSEIDIHPLTPSGASWKAGTQQFMKMTRATDLDVDGAGRLYAASWDGATFTYAGPNVGYVIALTPKGAKPAAVPDFKRLSDAQLVETVGSPSGAWRFAAQRELLARGPKPVFTKGLQQIVARNTNIGARVAAIFTLKQLLGAKSHSILIGYTKRDDLREFALKALADDPRVAPDVPAKPFLSALADTNPRVRLQAVTGLGRLGKTEAAEALLSRTADEDHTVAHIAVQALRWLRASDVCLRALDSADDKLKSGALRVLQSLYEPAVVDGLTRRLANANGTVRRGIYTTLCRLDMKEAPYTNPSMWWGTRPDTSGPIYKPERWEESDKIEEALKQYLLPAQGDDARAFVTALLRMKISFPGFSGLMLEKAGRDTGSRLDVIATLVSPKTPAPEDLLKALSAIATSPAETPELRARALRLLQTISERNFNAARDAFVTLASAEPSGPLAVVWEEFTRDGRHAGRVASFATLAKSDNPVERALGDTVLLNLVNSTVVKDNRAKGAARRALEGLWDNPGQAISLMAAIARTRSTQYNDQVRQQAGSANAAVASAAKSTLATLGLDPANGTGARTISDLEFAEVVKLALAEKGDARAGEQLFLKQGCVVCHTVSEKDPPKGPMLGGIARRYSRAELCESILKPSAKIAQGFESQSFKMKNGDQIDGFVVKEGGDSVEVRNIVGANTVLEKANIVERQKKDQSIMPEGLVGNITPAELASILAFLESTGAK